MRKNTYLAAVLACTVTWQVPAWALDTIKVANGQRGFGETAVSELGQNAGFFSKHGLALELLYTQGSGETVQSVISGSTVIGTAAGMFGVLGAFAKGAPLRIIGASMTGGSELYWYVTAASPIRTLKDAEGRTVGYSTNGSSTHMAVLGFQKELGVRFKAVATGTAPATLTQVMSGQIDVGWAGAPFAFEALGKGEIRLLARASDVETLRNQTSRVIIANATELGTRKDVFVRYMKAYREALAWMYTDEGTKAYAAWAKVDPAIAKRSLAEFLTRKNLDPDRISGIDDAMADATAFRYIPAPLPKQQVDQLIELQ